MLCGDRAVVTDDGHVVPNLGCGEREVGLTAGKIDADQRLYLAQEAAGQEGVGLGLYLANGIITRQKGYISVKSKVGEGTTFSVYLLS